MKMTRCLLHEKNLPKELWAEVANTIVFLLNRLPTRAMEKKTPFEAWLGIKPILKNLKVFGCLCFSYIPQVKRDKLEKKSEPGVFVGYSLVSKAYRIYHPKYQKVITSRDVQFLEAEEWNWANNTQNEPEMVSLELEELVDDTPVKDTRSLVDIYQRCNVAVLEPVDFEATENDKRWMSAMKEDLVVIKTN